MSKIRPAAKLIFEIFILLAILGIGINLIDSRLSKQLDDVDTTREEMLQNIPFKK